MTTKLPYSRQHIDDDDINEITKCLKNDIITGGEIAENFEKIFARLVNSKYAVSCANGTAALHLTAMALEITSKDCVIVPSITYAATANVFSIMGAEIILCDVDSESGLLTVKELENCLKHNLDKKPNYLCAVNLNGQICNPIDIKNMQHT